MIFTAIDPGGSTGYATFDNSLPIVVGQAIFGDDFYKWLSLQHPDLFVVEDYIIRPAHVQGGFAHQWNKGEALQVIGAVKYHAYKSGIPLELQQPSIKPIASKMSGIEYKKGKSGAHINDALLHGSYWWKTQGLK